MPVSRLHRLLPCLALLGPVTAAAPQDVLGHQVPGPDARTGDLPTGRDGKPLDCGFEDGSYRSWKVSGDAFGTAPVSGDPVAKRDADAASCHAGRCWASSYESSRKGALKGTLQSLPFRASHRYASFLVAGGDGPGTRVELVRVDDGSVVFQAKGDDSHAMRRVIADLGAAYRAGAELFVRVVDDSDDPRWGHIAFDDLRLHRRRPVAEPSRLRASRVLTHLVPNPVVAEGTTPDGVWVPEGFRVDRVAAAANVTQPIAFTFDPRGRMWIVEAHSYPEKQPEGEGKDRVVILADRDGDGEFESRTVFMAGLNLVSGIAVGHGGVWLGAAPQLLFVPDRDRDDKPDGDPVVLLDGFGFKDTHETLNSFTWGPDGWLYGVQGVFNHSKIGKPGAAERDRVELRAGVWRYHPTRHAFEVFAHGGSNQWGLAFDRHGQLFMTHCRSYWGGGPTTFVVRHGHYWNQANAHHAEFVSSPARQRDRQREAATLRNSLPSSARYGHGEGGAGARGSRRVYGGHSHVGTMIYQGDNWPEQYRNQLFTFNLHGHQLNRQVNKRAGSAYETVHSGADHLYVADPKFVGIDLQYGPDGAVYFIDWQDERHCHSPEAERWDRSNGRVYRMVYANTFAPVKVDLTARTDEQLLELLSHRNAWFADTARRLLAERHFAGTLSATVVPTLRRQLHSGAAGPARLQALWALHGIDGLAEEDHAALARDPAAWIRNWALRLAPERPGALARLADSLPELARQEQDPAVRLAISTLLPDLPPAARWAVGAALAAHRVDDGERFLPRMTWFGIAPLVRADANRAVRLAASIPQGLLADSILWYLSRDALGRAAVVAALSQLDAGDPRLLRGLQMLAWGLFEEDRVAAPAGFAALAARLDGDAAPPPLRTTLDEIRVRFGDAAVLARLRRTLADRGAADAERRWALDLLRRCGDRDCAGQLLAVLDDKGLRSAAIPMLGRFDDPKVAAALIARLDRFGLADRAAALVALSKQPALANALLDAVDEERIPRRSITALHVRDMQSLGDARITGRLRKSWGTAPTGAETKRRIDRYRKLYEEAPVWAYRRSQGEVTFRRLCGACHVQDGAGGELGPDLTGTWRNGLDYFLEAIVDPSALIGDAYRFHVVTRKDDTVVSGLLTSETDDALVIADANGSVRVRKADIAEHQTPRQSMMPAGLLDTLTEREVIELLKYLVRRE